MENTTTVEGVLVYKIPVERLFMDRDINDMKSALSDLVGKTPTVKLAIDFTGVDGISSRAIGVLVALRKAVKEVGGGMALFGLKPTVRKLLEVIRMDTLFVIKGDQAEAVKALGESKSFLSSMFKK